MKGIILAGGSGTRLYPLTKSVNKQLLAVHDKPMIYYPLTTLIAAGINEICIVSSAFELRLFEKLLGDGRHFGVKLVYRVQPLPQGIPEAFIVAADFVGEDDVTLILGDNIFVDSGELRTAITNFRSGATILGYRVSDPQRFGVIKFDCSNKPISIEEKPQNPPSNFIVPGFYVYENSVVAYARALTPSGRGELEITDLNNIYIEKGQLKVDFLSRGSVWIDAGNPTSLSRASRYIATVEENHGLKIGCPEEAALVRGFLTKSRLEEIEAQLPDCEYKTYLGSLLIEPNQEGLDAYEARIQAN